MELELTFEIVSEKHIMPDCPFLPDNDEYENHLDWILDDIRTISGVSDAQLFDANKMSVVLDNITKKVFAAQLEPFLTSHFSYLRLTNDSRKMLVQE